MRATPSFNTQASVLPEIFRAYDIRGIVDGNFTPDVVYTLGLAIGSEALVLGEKRIVVGRDGRLSGEYLLEALIQGLMATGCDVINVGEVPTPVLYFAAQALGTSSGVMLTGSHNPPNYNGLKIVLAGMTLAEDGIQRLYQRVLSQQFVSGSGLLEMHAIEDAYIQRITQDVHLSRRLKVVVDCGNGVTGICMPKLLTALGCDVIPLFCEVDGHFPNHHPDPSQLENLQDLIQTVLKEQADVGLALDGDGDRLGVVDSAGYVIWADRQLMLYAIDVLSRNKGARIIYDIKSSRHVETVVKQHGGEPILWKTGHSLIKGKMRETGALLGGEMSGHIFFKERWYGFDDALYAAARLLEILSASSESSHTLFSALPDSVNTPELKLAVPEEHKFELMTRIINRVHFPDGELNTLDGLRVEFSDGWGLIRPSNTSPYLVMRFEAEDASGLQRIQSAFRDQLLGVDPTLLLPF